MATDDLDGHFYVGYDPRSRFFKAYACRSPHKTFRNIAIDGSLDDLLEDCKKIGLTYFDGLTREAAEVVHEWLMYRPAVEYVEQQWGGATTSKRGLMGFLPSQGEDEDG